MVLSNRGPPDDTPADNLPSSTAEIIITDSEEEDENHSYDGYLPLATNEEEVSQNEEPDNAIALPPIIRLETELVHEVWVGPSTKDIEMDKEKVDTVKQVMANVVLPPSAIPEWANNIPEEQWKEKLISRLEKMRK